MSLGIFHCQFLITLQEKIHFAKSEEELSRVVLDELAKTLAAAGGTVYKISEQGHILPLAAVGMDIARVKQVEFHTGKGITGWIAKYNKPAKIDDAQKDERFVGLTDAVTGLKTRNIVAAPILLRGVTIGVIEFVNKTGSAFNNSDLELVAAVGKELGPIFHNVSMIESLEQSQTYLKSIVNGLNAGLLVIDASDNMQIINQRAAQIFKIPANAMQRPERNITELASAAPQAHALLSLTLREKAVVPRAEAKVSIGGAEIILGYSAMPIKTGTGAYAGMTFLFQDITGYQKKG